MYNHWMSVSTTHPEYDLYAPKWRKVRVSIAGEEAVKEAGSEFLPILIGQTSEGYNGYKMRAMFYGASARTVQGLTGAIFRKPPEVLFPKSKLDFLAHLGRSRESLDEMGALVVVGDRFACRERMAFGDEPHKWSVWRALDKATVELVADGLDKGRAITIAQEAAP